jgi:hypothetical protein
LSTPTAVKVAEIIPWIHHRQVKPDIFEWECIPDPVYHTRSPSTGVEGYFLGDHKQCDISPAVVTLEVD